MEDWKEFEGQSKEEWIRAIEKELGKSIDNEKNTYVYAHPEDQIPELNPLLINDSFSSWNIRERFILDENFEMQNKLILESLESGVQELYLVSSKIIEPEQLRILFDQVYLNMINVHWKSPFQEEVLTFFSSNRPSNLILEWDDLTIHDYDQKVNHGISISNSMILRQRSAKRTSEIKSLFRQALTILENKDDKGQSAHGPEQVILLVHAEQDFIHEISFLRAVRLVWANMNAALGFKPTKIPLKIISVVGEYQDPVDLNSNLIRSTIQAMASVLGGSTSIEIMPSNGDLKDNNRKRLSRNIHHLLSLESFLDKVIDPAAGSYSFQMLTRNYCDEIWKSLQ